MQLNYELCAGDLVNAQRLFLRRKRPLLFWGGLIYGAILFLFSLFLALTQSLFSAVPILLASGYVALLPSVILPLAARGVWNKTPVLHGPTTLRLAPEGFEIFNPLSRALVRAQALQDSVQDAQMWMLFLGPGSYYLVPRRAFDTPAQAQEFEESIAKFVAMNAPKSPISAP